MQALLHQSFFLGGNFYFIFELCCLFSATLMDIETPINALSRTPCSMLVVGFGNVSTAREQRGVESIFYFWPSFFGSFVCVCYLLYTLNINHSAMDA